jgi:FlaA1/EpsC-like NDP-sugar epimerase
VIQSIEDLNWCSFLARPPLPPPFPEALDAMRQKSILITGAGGSIGSALAQRLAALIPPELVLLEASESHLYSLKREWTAGSAAGLMPFILGSAADRTLL